MIKTVKTRKEHICEFCNKVIPKGSEVIVLQQEGYGGYWVGNDYYNRRKFYHRKYWHKNCYLAEQIVGKIDKFDDDFHVYRTITEVVYLIRGKEIKVKLDKRWNRCVEKWNKIHEFMRVNGLTMFNPHNLDLLRIEVSE
jgi:hypothetical protein